mgnify:CR=1 FL=1
MVKEHRVHKHVGKGLLLKRQTRTSEGAKKGCQDARLEKRTSLKLVYIYVMYTYICNFARMQILRTMNMHALSVSSTMCKVQEIVNLPAHDFLVYVVIHMQ